ncbi:hypothetical protein, partial [uncultured Clostridium sp.]|uniref:hypothetical protein n=1 Tax=uncultured Clostridium sp. TaxID=59620 RepID=UPI002587BF0D
MADKKFYGMALQLERKYDRLVLQKNKIKKEVPKDFLPIWMHSIGYPLIVKISLVILCFSLVAR